MITIAHIFICDYCGTTHTETYCHELHKALMEPKLPEGWREVDMAICCQGHRITVSAVADE